jgi:predicted nucleotidyltransferase
VGVIELAYEASRVLVDALGSRIVAVALFGSWVRGEASDRSDVDFFVVFKDFNEEDRRFKIYHYLYSVLKRDITVIDADEEKLFRNDLVITPLLLNIAWDSIVLYDPSGKLKELFKRIREAVKDKLERYKTKDGKYGWKPKNKHFTTITV